MALVFAWEQVADRVTRPLILQSFVNHGGCIHKVYVLDQMVGYQVENFMHLSVARKFNRSLLMSSQYQSGGFTMGNLYEGPMKSNSTMR